tara:strand:- start:24 stop:335 length:312 start_codon:yes stop_codon:yes gene_type:complete
LFRPLFINEIAIFYEVRSRYGRHPANGLLFVFLSNRVHPTRNNSKIYQLNIRPNIHNLVYNLLDEGSYGLGWWLRGLRSDSVALWLKPLGEYTEMHMPNSLSI